MPPTAPAVSAESIFDEAAGISGETEESSTVPTPAVEIPNFKKLKKAELIDFFAEHAPHNEMGLVDFQSLTVPVIKQKLIHLFPDAEALDGTEVTGYDGQDPIHHTIAAVQALASEKEAIEYINGLSDETQFNFFKMGGAQALAAAGGGPIPSPRLRLARTCRKGVTGGWQSALY